MSVLIVPLLLAGVLGTSFASASYMEGRGQGQNLNEEQRAVMQEVKELHQSGDHEAAMERMKENGIHPKMKMSGPKGEMRGAVHEAVVANDYDAFMDAIEGSPLEEIADEGTFELLVEAYELREDGDYEEARELMEDFREEAGLPHPHRMHHNK